MEQITDKSFIENRNKTSGMHFEEMISYSCKKYHEEGKLYMWNPSMQKTAQSDYKGTLVGGMGFVLLFLMNLRKL